MTTERQTASPSRERISDFMAYMEEQCDVIDRAYEVLKGGYDIALENVDETLFLEVYRAGEPAVCCSYLAYIDGNRLSVTPNRDRVKAEQARHDALAQEVAAVLVAAGLPVDGR